MTPRPLRRSALVALVAAVALVVGAVTGAGAQVEPTPPPPPSPTTESTTTTTAPDTTTTTAPDTSTTVPDTTLTPPVDGSTTTTQVLPPGAKVTPDALAQLRDLTGQLDDLTDDEKQLLDGYIAILQRILDSGTQLNQITNSITGAQAELAAAQTLVDESEQQLATVQRDLDDTDAKLADQQQLLRDHAVAAYISGGNRFSVTDALLKGRDADEFGVAKAYAGAVQADGTSLVERYERTRDDAQRLRDQAASYRNAAVSARNAKSNLEAELEAQRDAQVQAALEAQQAATDQQGLLEQAGVQRAAYEQKIAQLTQSSGSIGAALKARQGGQNVPLVTAGIFVSPVPNPLITSPFGPRLHPIYGIAKMHNGADINASMGTPIRAAADGQVIIASVQGGYGNCTVIDHGNGLGTLYGHQSAFGVQVGDRVTKGQVIGFAGSTGASTGPHVHFEVRVFGDPVNPIPYLGPG
jgi:murein DD-endopeptidase MepM/ murein hydrolase activator NlpD